MIAIPVLVWLGTVGESLSIYRLRTVLEGSAAVSGAMVVASSVSPQVAMSLGAFNFGLLFWAFAVAANLLLTGLVLLRLLRARRHAVITLGKSHDHPYTSVVVNLIKSSLLFTLVQIVFLALFGDDQSFGFLFLSVLLVQLQVSSPFDVIGTDITANFMSGNGSTTYDPASRPWASDRTR
jgi:hypothetical protein